ncbi:hypothetical protein [Paenibacillus vortex]|uniref:hypothetical protein n=1 Tax=Paenibacillus vortex TaxID=71995 RepID=UPI000304628F|nr:hypothetical protein [Paenibacillus vortex]
MEFKNKAWKPIFASFLMSILFSYLLMVGFYVIGPGGDLTQLLLEPVKVVSFAYAQVKFESHIFLDAVCYLRGHVVFHEVIYFVTETCGCQ